MITRTIAILILCAPDDRNRRVYGVYRATGANRESTSLEIQQEVTTLTLVRDEQVDVHALAKFYATESAPVWEKL